MKKFFKKIFEYFFTPIEKTESLSKAQLKRRRKKDLRKANTERSKNNNYK